MERFGNGDPQNDPMLEAMEGSWPHVSPEGWRITPWTHDWYEQALVLINTSDSTHVVQLPAFGTTYAARLWSQCPIKLRIGGSRRK